MEGYATEARVRPVTALLTPGTVRTMSVSRRRPTSRFQPGIAAMYACTGASPSAFAICGLPPVRSFTGLAFFAGGPSCATAAFASALNAPASTFSPSWMSIALRVLPTKLELKRRDGSGILAPRANVSFTTFVYASPVQTIPWCDQTGVPIHFHSSVISGSASRISARTRARVSPRHPPRSRIRWSMSREAGSPVARSRILITFAPFRTLIGLASLAPGLAFAPAFGGDLDLVADLRGLLARDLPLAFGFALPVRKTRYDLPSLPAKDLRSRPRPLLFGFSATVHSPTCCDAQRSG